MKRVLHAIVPISLLLAPLVAASAQSDMSRVKIDTGVLPGLTQNDVTWFKGIPFAAPPVVKNRWRAPSPRPIPGEVECGTSTAVGVHL